MRQATLFCFNAVVIVAAASLLSILGGTADLGHVLAVATVAVCAYPMWRYLAHRSEAVPAFPFIAALYGLFFGGTFLLIDEPYQVFEHVSRDTVINAQATSFVGILILVAAYYGYVPGIPVRSSLIRPPILHPLITMRAAVAAGFIGACAEIVRSLTVVPLEAAAVVALLGKLALLAIGLLFYLQLRNHLRVGLKWCLWGGFVNVLVVLRLVSGSPYLLIELGAVLLLVYVAARQLIPLKAIAAGLLVILPLLAFKADYRQLAWFEGRTDVSSPGEVLEKASLFVGVAAAAVASADKSDLLQAGSVVLRRGDHVYEFAHYMKETPSAVPYLSGETYADFFWKFLPRAVATEKPESKWGNELAHRYGLLAPNDDSTSINIPQMIEMYLNFGFLGVIIGMYILGQLYRVLLKWGNRPNANEWSVAALAVIGASLLNIESDFLLVFGGTPYLLVLLYLTPRVIGSLLGTGVPRRFQTQSGE